MKISEDKQETLNRIVNDLKSINNVTAIVLGGSYSTGMANENSDLDIGIYYHESSPFSIESIKSIADKYNSGDETTVTSFYQWGAWVNGGAWIETKSGEVDFVYRNIEQVKSTIEKSKEGIYINDFEQQPPYGFSSTIYLAETYYCVPLFDPENIIQNLKKEVKQYPEKLKQTITQQSLWSAEFTLWQADKFAKKFDFYNTVGCFSRALKNIIEALLAINELYSIGDKKSMEVLKRAPKLPEKLESRIEVIVNLDKQNIVSKTNELRQLFEETVSFAKDSYHPYFKL
ncbi:nucleotidyltransferase domain-containing protein [Leptospira brenneri]|uniref:Polymerase nucleotidyl transferase domain-containing protein n=1 Tax=Leptospira brenneri TaxID=2023182 RepID=A0A2M9Y5K3_9LEPT|nr:nucleotidyltransferase domain-containing protein [Leptospira brenneri]PJZ46860.1 hypothetical protein CH361_00410 [Leptospira brenneri]TGK96185.1 hypothetical protein EHQ30_06110 [Leptospira brenneri]